MKRARCKRLDNLSHVIPGWGCCKCRAYNSYQRETCKGCGHIPCYPQKIPGPDKPVKGSHRYLLRITCSGTVDAPGSKCEKSIVMAFEIAGSKDLFIKAMDAAGWYASECGVGPDEGTRHILTALCPACAAILLPKDVIDVAEHLRGDRQRN